MCRGVGTLLGLLSWFVPTRFVRLPTDTHLLMATHRQLPRLLPCHFDRSMSSPHPVCHPTTHSRHQCPTSPPNGHPIPPPQVEVVPGNIPAALAPISTWPWLPPSPAAPAPTSPAALAAARATVASAAERAFLRGDLEDLEGEGAGVPIVVLDPALSNGSQLPALQVGLTSRDGRTLRKPPNVRLEAGLWQLPPPPGQHGSNAQQQQQQDGQQQDRQQQEAEGQGQQWLLLTNYTRKVNPPRTFGSARDCSGGAGGAQGALGGEGEGPQQWRQPRVTPVYEFGAGGLALPPVPGLYKWVLRYLSECAGEKGGGAWVGHVRVGCGWTNGGGVTDAFQGGVTAAESG